MSQIRCRENSPMDFKTIQTELGLAQDRCDRWPNKVLGRFGSENRSIWHIIAFLAQELICFVCSQGTWVASRIVLFSVRAGPGIIDKGQKTHCDYQSKHKRGRSNLCTLNFLHFRFLAFHFFRISDWFCVYSGFEHDSAPMGTEFGSEVFSEPQVIVKVT